MFEFRFKIILLSLIWCSILLCCSAEDDECGCSASKECKCEIKTEYGTIIGVSSQTRNGRTICNYLGIPFAEPPIGALRFKNPVPAKPWSGTLNATVEGEACFQRTNFSLTNTTATSGQEDCLTLNLYVCAQCDANWADSEKVPTLIFIHGGAWTQGSNKVASNGPSYICDKNVVYVSINYRLDIFGFMTTGDDYAPGNLGMKDQTLAFQWVHDYIDVFRGSREQTCIFGDTVGGEAVPLHFAALSSKGLFTRGFSMSGTDSSPVALRFPEEVIEPTKAVAKECGCPTSSSEELVECLQKVTPEKLIEAQNVLGPDDCPSIPAFVQLYWIPILDYQATNITDPFFDEDPRTTSSSVPYVNGISVYDGNYFSGHYADFTEFLQRVIDEPYFYLPELLFLGTSYPQGAIPAVINRIIDHYFGNEKPTLDTLTVLCTDRFYVYPSLETTFSHDGPSWYFYHSYVVGSGATFANLYSPPGVLTKFNPGLGDIQFLLYNITSFEIFETALDIKISTEFIQLLYNFAKFGHPSQNGCPTKWNQVGSACNFTYLSINTTIEQKHDKYLIEVYNFWKSLEEFCGTLIA